MAVGDTGNLTDEIRAAVIRRSSTEGLRRLMVEADAELHRRGEPRPHMPRPNEHGFDETEYDR